MHVCTLEALNIVLKMVTGGKFKINNRNLRLYMWNVWCVGCFESEVKVPFKVLCLIY